MEWKWKRGGEARRQEREESKEEEGTKESILTRLFHQ
jgi:hypothetical protein